jgi:hypothetical protein
MRSLSLTPSVNSVIVRSKTTTLTNEEIKFWIESAKKEYFFKNDRSLSYEPQEV